MLLEEITVYVPVLLLDELKQLETKIMQIHRQVKNFKIKITT